MARAKGKINEEKTLIREGKVRERGKEEAHMQ